MIKLLIAFICAITVTHGIALNELDEAKAYVAQLTEQNEIYQAEIQELSNQEYSLKEMFQVAAEVYDIDFDMLYAIARLETGNFTSNLFVNNNNPGGIKDFYSKSGWASYETQFQGIMEMARLLKRDYIDCGLTTPETIGPKYCPGSESWIRQVRDLMGR